MAPVEADLGPAVVQRPPPVFPCTYMHVHTYPLTLAHTHAHAHSAYHQPHHAERPGIATGSTSLQIRGTEGGPRPDSFGLPSPNPTCGNGLLRPRCTRRRGLGSACLRSSFSPTCLCGLHPPLSIPLSFYIFAAILWARGWFVHCGTEVPGPLCPQGPTTGRRCWAHHRPGTPGGGAGPTSRAWLTAVLSASPSRTCPMSVTMTPQSTSASKGTPCRWGAMRPTPSSGRR